MSPLTNSLLVQLNGQLTYEPPSNQDAEKRNCPCIGAILYPIDGEEAVVTLESRSLSSGGYQIRASRVSAGS